MRVQHPLVVVREVVTLRLERSLPAENLARVTAIMKEMMPLYPICLFLLLHDRNGDPNLRTKALSQYLLMRAEIHL